MKKRADCLAHLNTVCRETGMKLTQQRLEVYNELAHAADHPSPETLHQRLLPKMPSLSLDTVYRTLATLAEYDLVRRVETLQSQVRYEAVQSSHHHMICRECHKISDFEWASFEGAGVPKITEAWGMVERKSAVLTGLCNECKRISAREKTTPVKNEKPRPDKRLKKPGA